MFHDAAASSGLAFRLDHDLLDFQDAVRIEANGATIIWAKT
jgi:hypothetical protein